MKKYFLVTVVILSMLMFQGCSKSSSKDNEATKAVTAFMDSIIDGNFEKAYENFESANDTSSEIKDNPMNDFIFSQIKYEVVESKVNEDTATVKIKVTHPVFQDIIKSITEYMTSENIKLLESHDSEEDVTKLLQDTVDEIKKDDKIAVEETEVELELKLVEGKWVISEDCSLISIFGVQ